MKSRSLLTPLMTTWHITQHGLAMQPPKKGPNIELSSIKIDTDHPSMSRQPDQLHLFPPTDASTASQPGRGTGMLRTTHLPSVRSILTQRRPNGAPNKASEIVGAPDHIENIPSRKGSAQSASEEHRQPPNKLWSKLGPACTSGLHYVYKSLPTWKTGNDLVNTAGQLTAAFMTIAVLRHQIYWQKQAYLIPAMQSNNHLGFQDVQESRDFATAVHAGVLTPDGLNFCGQDGRNLFPFNTYRCNTERIVEQPSDCNND